MKNILILALALAGTASSYAVEGCPWFTVHFVSGEAQMSKAEQKAFDQFLRKQEGRIGKIRIYGLAEPRGLASPQDPMFRKRATRIKEFIAPWLYSKPGWKVATERTVTDKQSIAAGPDVVEVEFHDYTDPHRHEQYNTATNSSSNKSSDTNQN